jgi:endonuclease YncB( thermonuclease family)
VVEVVDVDTLEVDGGPVRPIGIDVPKIGSCEAEAARQRLAE